MKVVVRSKEGNFTIPIPFFILKNGVRLTNFIFKTVMRKSPDSEEAQKFREYMEYIDMDVLLTGVDELKKHKGLKLVEVKGHDGSYVLVQV